MKASMDGKARRTLDPPPALLTTKQAARALGVSESFLERDRCYGAKEPGSAGARIPFVKVGERAIRYDPNMIWEYLRNRTHKVTARPLKNDQSKRKRHDS